MKKFFALLIAVGLVFPFTLGCGGETKKPDDKKPAATGEKKPGGEEKKPGGEEKKPGGEEKKPS